MTKHFSIVFTFLFISLFAGDISAQKITVEKVKDVLINGAKFSADDLSALEKGELVVKELEAATEGEVAFCGAIMLQAPRDVVFAAFRRAVEKQRKEVSEERGFFRKPPTVSDLKKLSIDPSDIRGLKDCRPGDCKWSLSEDLIKRVTEEIDWSASGAEEKASELIKKIMVEHLSEYLQKGDTALMTYNDDPEPLSLAEEQRSLLENLLWLDDFAPEFKEYLQNYPNGKLENVEDLPTWEKIKVVFKPVIINSHGIFYKKEEDGIPQGLILSKQIYANHYFHSSMSLTGIVSFPQADQSFKTYLFFVSHSRAGALTGTMGKLARTAVDGEAETKLTDVLKDTKRYTAYDLGSRDAIEEETESGMIKRLFTNKFFIFLIIVVLAVGVIIWMTRKSSKY